jgi:transposase-like protein
MFLLRGIVFCHEAVRDWEAKLAPVLADKLRRRRHGKGGTRGRQWHVDETYLKVMRSGISSARQIAKALNERVILTPRGGQWYAASVQRVLSRMTA